MAFCADCLTIGSRPPADLVLREPSVSPLHARLTRTAGGFLIEDLGSRGGIYVGPRRVSRAHVDYRQLFRVGRVAVMLLEDGVVRSGACPADSAEPTVPLTLPNAVMAIPPATGQALSRSVLGAALGVAALAAVALWIGRVWMARAPEKPTTLTANTSFLTLTPDAEAVRFELDPRLSFWVPSAAVSSTAVLSATRIERPREPTTVLLRAEGPGAWLDFVSDEPSINGILPLFGGRGNAPVPPLWGQYLPSEKRWNFAPSSVALRLRGASLVVALVLARGTVLKTAGHFQFLYSGASGVLAQQLDAFHAKLESTWQHFDSLGYPLPATPVLTLLDAEAGRLRPPSCQSHLDFKWPLGDLSPKQLERALLAVVLRESGDCRDLGGPRSGLETTEAAELSLELRRDDFTDRRSVDSESNRRVRRAVRI